MSRPLVGAHVSSAGGHYKCFENAKSIGAEAIQIFGASPRQWFARVPQDKDLAHYQEIKKKYQNIPVFLHAAYLVNLASQNKELNEKSVQSLIDHLTIAEKLHAVGLIFHIGSGIGQTKAEAIEKIVIGIKKVLAKVKGTSYLILENTSGGGNKIGSDPHEIGEILKKVKSNRAKVCIDTAHVFESGVLNEFTKQNIKNFINTLDATIGLKNLVCLHLNDSKTKAGSNHDRHENIGEGYIGMEGFKNLSKEKRLLTIPWVLEVPGFHDMGPDKKNIGRVKSLFI